MGRLSDERKESVRGRLLAEAAKHFADRGYEAANVNEIALAAGFAKGTIYNYFESKDELFGAVVAEAARKAVARYSSVRSKDSVRDSLRSLAAADLSVFKEEEPFMKVLVGEAVSPSPVKYGLILKHLSPFISAISEILTKGQERNEVRDDKPVVQLALVFLGILTLLYIQHWKSGGGWPALDEIPDLAVTTFLDGAGEGGRQTGLEKRKAIR